MIPRKFQTLNPLTGPQGVPGPQGKSNYEIALDNGFEGTEAEWLESLKANTSALEDQIAKIIGEVVTEDNADSLVYSEGLAYTLNADGTGYIVTGIGECTDTDLVIPPTYEGLPVVEIGDSAFAFKFDAITGVVIPDGVTRIGVSAFASTNIEYAEIPDSVKRLEESAFNECLNLKEFVIGKDVEYIGDNMFAWGGLESLTILAETPPTINTYTLNACENLKTVHVPANSVEAYKAAWADYAEYITAIVEKKAPSLWELKAYIETLESKADMRDMELASLSTQLVDETTARQTKDDEHYNHLVTLFEAIENLSTIDAQLGEQIKNEETKRMAKDDELAAQNANTLAFAQQVQQLVVNVHSTLQNQINTINTTLNSFVNVAEVGA